MFIIEKVEFLCFEAIGLVRGEYCPKNFKIKNNNKN